MIDIIENLNTKPETNQRTAQSASDGAAKMMQQKAGAQGQTGSSGKINVMGNLGVQQQEQQADAMVNKAAQVNKQQFQQQNQMNEANETEARVWDEQVLGQQNAYQRQFDTAYNNFANSKKQLGGKYNQMAAQTAATTLRLQNQEYVDKLNLTMQKELQSKRVTEEQLTEQIAFGQEFERLKKQGEWKLEFETDKIDREFMNSKEALEQAFKNGQTAIASDREAKMYGDIATGIETGASGYQNYQANQSSVDTQNRQAFDDERSGYAEWLSNKNNNQQ